MERKESSSSVDNIDMDDKEENIDIVTAMTTPFQPTAIKLHASTLRKMKEQEEWIKAQQKQIEDICEQTRIAIEYSWSIHHLENPVNPSPQMPSLD
jgi:alpha-D-ribose 1-methylphosphonate 5-phosphate C-P lyase